MSFMQLIEGSKAATSSEVSQNILVTSFQVRSPSSVASACEPSVEAITWRRTFEPTPEKNLSFVISVEESSRGKINPA
jgi:hypothetical protein